ncbi:MAG TPA: type II toxin-antitoxin system VapC family toxin [bacterium]|nr:type II toxin-antitoxin system VapC family toxin [bacterium]
MKCIFVDSNIILNVWRREINPTTGENYSLGSKRILKEINRGTTTGYLLSTTAMEIIHGVRVESEVSRSQAPAFAIKQAEARIAEIGLKIAVPDSVVMSYAYELLVKIHVDPFDAVLISAAVKEKAEAVISRDKKLKKKAMPLISVLTPEEFFSN